MNKIEQVVALFNQTFELSEKTTLEYGADEPFYSAPKLIQGSQENDVQTSCAVIYAREDYFSSGLHEVAHWCIAGKERRQLDDFGYWYQPEGRSMEAQKAFESVEIKPQALELLFSFASNIEFYFSADNLSESIGPSDEFKSKVKIQANRFLEQGLSIRAQQFFNSLLTAFHETPFDDRKSLELACKQYIEAADV